jgi:hypothetical protein
MNTDAEFDALGGRDLGVARDHRALHLDRTAHRVDDAGEFDQQAVAGRFDDAAAVLGDLRVTKLAADRPQSGKRALLIGLHQPRIARDIGRQDRREAALDPLPAHGAILSQPRRGPQRRMRQRVRGAALYPRVAGEAQVVRAIKANRSRGACRKIGVR